MELRWFLGACSCYPLYLFRQNVYGFNLSVFVCLKRMPLLSGLGGSGFKLAFMDFRKIIEYKGLSFIKNKIRYFHLVINLK